MNYEIDEEDVNEWVEENKHLFKSVTKIMKIITALEPEEYESVLIMVLSNCVMHGQDSLVEARDAIVRVASKSVTAVNEFDNRGLCAWNGTRQ